MPFTDASDYLTQFRTQLAACAVWTGGASTIHYPNVDWASATLPCIVIIEDQRSDEHYAMGAVGLRAGTLRAILYSSGTVGAVETLADTLIVQLVTQASGIPFRGGSRGPAGDAEDAKKAGGTEVRGVEITFEYGLQA